MKDSRRVWIGWKVLIYGMTEQEATKASYDPNKERKRGIIHGWLQGILPVLRESDYVL